jgi:peroxiredoxin
MKKKMLIVLMALPLLVTFCGKSENLKAKKHQEVETKVQAAEKEEIKKRIKEQLEKAYALSNEEKYDQALIHLREVVKLSVNFSQKFQVDMLDYKQYLLMKTENFQEALDTAFQIEAMSQKISERKSPWNCLKIAEAYMALGKKENSLKWLEKAVYERSFKHLEYFRDDRFSVLRDDRRYLKLIEAVKNEIGLDRQARDFQVILLDGSPFSLSAQKGKVILVDFWDVNCPPCRKEMPHLKEIYKDFKKKGLEIIGISLDTDKKLLEDFLEETAVPWKMACSFKGWSDDTVKLYKINATPSTWLIDRKGFLRYYNLRGEELRQAVEKVIKES